MTEDEMVGWHHSAMDISLSRPGSCDGQGSLACCSPWDHKELDTIDWTELSMALPTRARHSFPHSHSAHQEPRTIKPTASRRRTAITES